MDDFDPAGMRASETAPAFDRFQHVTFVAEQPDAAKPTRFDDHARPNRQNSVPPVVLDADSATFFEDLCADWGLDVTRYRTTILWRRRAACLRAMRAPSPAAGSQLIRADRQASERALGAVMIGVTAFFRDAPVFERLATLLASHCTGPALNVLSVGCANGAELYSLAMLLADQGRLDSARFWGIDCRPAAITRAKAGVYPEAATTAIPLALRNRYLSPEASQPAESLAPSASRSAMARIEPALRNRCRWAVADAFAGLPSGWPGQYDLILCRNLAIYLTVESAAELWRHVAARLAPGGLLVVGKAERPPKNLPAGLVRVGPCIYRSRTAPGHSQSPLTRGPTES